MRKWISSSSWLLVASSSLSFSALRPEQWPLSAPSYFSPIKFPWRTATTTFPSAVLIKLALEKFRVEFARWTGIARFETLYSAPSRSPTPLVFFARNPRSSRIAFFYFSVEKTNFLVPKLRALPHPPLPLIGRLVGNGAKRKRDEKSSL